MKRTILSMASALLMALPLFSQCRTPQIGDSYTFAGQKVEISNSYMQERLDREIIAFTYMHSASTLMLKRSGKVFPEVVPIIKACGMPEDLKYFMVIESDLNPIALSRTGAAGLWQLMPDTAKGLGLQVDDNVDERYNTEKATRAACKLLKTFYNRFGDWLNAAAGYNCGANGLARRIDTQHQNKVEDLWLPEETSRYVFRLLVAKKMFEDPASFGFDIPEAERYRYYEPKRVVTVTTAIEDLVAFAEEHGTTYAALKRANLWLREDNLKNPKGKEYKIIIPSDK